jgi:hypothetical protein
MHASNNFFRIIVAFTLCLHLVSGMSTASRFGVPRTVPVGTVPQVILDFLWSDGMTYFFPHKHPFYFISQSRIEFLSLNDSLAERRPNSLQLHT